MPTYQAICPTCNTYHEYIRPASRCLETPECCGVATEKRIYSAPAMRADIAPWDAYESPATGKMITSYAERRADMKASGCRDWEGQAVERREAAKTKAADEAKMDASIDATVRTAWAQLSPTTKAAALAGT